MTTSALDSTAFPQRVFGQQSYRRSTSSSCYSAVIGPFKRLSERIQQTRLYRWYEKYEPHILLDNLFDAATKTQKVVLAFFASSGENVHLETHYFWETSSYFACAIKVAKVLSLLSTPIAFLQLLKYGYYFVIGSRDEKVDSAFSFIEELSIFIDSVTAFCRGLHEVGVLPRFFIQWATPAAIVSTIFSTVTILAEAKRLWQSGPLLKGLNKLLEMKEEAQFIDEAEKFFKDLSCREDNFLLKQFSSNPGNLKTCLKKVVGEWEHRKELKLPHQEGFNKIEDFSNRAFVVAFKNRIISKRISSTLSIIAVIVSTVALGIICFSGLTMAGYPLLALAAIITLAKYFQDKTSLHHFEKEIGISSRKRPPWRETFSHPFSERRSSLG